MEQDPGVDIRDRYTQEFWDQRYGAADAIWSGNPNPQLVAQGNGLRAGAALDVGSGEGGDAIWLAGRGWRVTGVDVSPVALARAAARAEAAGADLARRITWQQADVLTWEPPPLAYDLVSAQYLHLPRAWRESLHRRLAAAVRPGGTLLIVGHHPSDLQTTVRRPALPELFATAEEMATVLDPGDWRIMFAGAPERQASDAEGRAVTIHDAVLAAQRRRA